MGDATLTFDSSIGYSDLSMSGHGLLTGLELETAVQISLFTDAQADPGDVVNDPDPRGWWADTYAALEDPALPLIARDRIGSKLWQIFSRPRNQETLNWMADQIRISLNWMLVDGVASNIEAKPRFTSKGGVGAEVVITSFGVRTVYDYAWAQEGG